MKLRERSLKEEITKTRGVLFSLFLCNKNKAKKDNQMGGRYELRNWLKEKRKERKKEKKQFLSISHFLLEIKLSDLDEKDILISFHHVLIYTRYQVYQDNLNDILFYE
jgi:hypothetical protein